MRFRVSYFQAVLPLFILISSGACQLGTMYAWREGEVSKDTDTDQILSNNLFIIDSEIPMVITITVTPPASVVTITQTSAYRWPSTPGSTIPGSPIRNSASLTSDNSQSETFQSLQPSAPGSLPSSLPSLTSNLLPSETFQLTRPQQSAKTIAGTIGGVVGVVAVIICITVLYMGNRGRGLAKIGKGGDNAGDPHTNGEGPRTGGHDGTQKRELDDGGA